MPTPISTTGGEAEHSVVAAEAVLTALQIERRARWTAARFGCFVHWGLPALTAGCWDGKRVQGLSEWIQFTAKIPLSSYRRLAEQFDPVDFDARTWVRMAADAGARYFVYTAKHHDGFAMYRSSVSAYNIADATPFKRDPLAEIAEACREFGLMLGIYYSHVIDWEDPDAIGPQCNSWDFDVTRGDFHRYWGRKAMPQLRELLRRYGDIAVLWFDMPDGIPPGCAQEASDLVRQLQPGAVINSRLGGGDADYQSMDDNYFNNHLPDRYWETAATTNETWTFAADSSRWKPAAALCEALAYAVSRGGNYLLNVGPDALGVIPQQAVQQFAMIGRWMKRASPGIHEADRPPFASSFEWGVVTRGKNALFLHVNNGAKDSAALPGLRTIPSSAVDLATNQPLEITRLATSGPGNAGCRLRLAPPTDELPRTIKLAFNDEPRVSDEILQAPGEAILLNVHLAEVEGNVLRWEFDLADPGTYRVVLLSKQTSSHANPQWYGEGLRGRLLTAGSETAFVLSDDGREPYPIIQYWQLVRSEVGELHISQSGRHWIEIHDLCVCDSKWRSDAVNLVGVRLEPRRGSRDRIGRGGVTA